jgi:hypothetical protein
MHEATFGNIILFGQIKQTALVDLNVNARLKLTVFLEVLQTLCGLLVREIQLGSLEIGSRVLLIKVYADVEIVKSLL